MNSGEIVTLILGATGTIGGFFAGKRTQAAKALKIEAEAGSIALTSSEKAVAIWERLNKQLNTELEIFRLQVEEIKKENENLHRENLELKRQIELLRDEIRALKLSR